MATFTGKADDDYFPSLSTLNDYFASVVQVTTPTAVSSIGMQYCKQLPILSILLYRAFQGTVLNQALYSSKA